MPRTATIWVWPPEARNRQYGNGTAEVRRAVKAWASRWLIAISGLPLTSAIALAVVRPTMTPPIRPGPAAAATPSMASKLLPASAIARAITRSSASTWARAAISGTTPPNEACSQTCDSTTLDRILPDLSPSRSTNAAAVSSQVVSIPSTTMATPALSATIARSGDAILWRDPAARHAWQPTGVDAGRHGARRAGPCARLSARPDRARPDPHQRRPHPGPNARRRRRQGFVHQGDRRGAAGRRDRSRGAFVEGLADRTAPRP